ncbi:hypothetical protein C922_02024 [Plasmodium inui San Antonio 1]|uniref:Pv-fam-b protein n=1 Tax=Plasmodium inui San Antonio 1 TaxID=1237626 RepID=W7A834_9APIC|nr:hypothetical protein C922_02024 [Plasmodium inui San Antonio 1]EUD67835.1 hypothetical protein C922_02024 [Plasmodium inui San Antonio 1]
MKEKALSARTTIALEYQKRLHEAVEKINMVKEKLKKQKIMNAEVFKMVVHQKASEEIRDSIKRKYNAVEPSALDSMKHITKKEKVPNPVGVKDSKIERKIFKAYCHIDECERNPRISKKQFTLLKIRIYGTILALPFVIVLTALGLCAAGFALSETYHFCSLGLCAVSFITFLYILVKVLKYDLRSNGIYKPRFMDYVRSFRRCIK